MAKTTYFDLGRSGYPRYEDPVYRFVGGAAGGNKTVAVDTETVKVGNIEVVSFDAAPGTAWTSWAVIDPKIAKAYARKISAVVEIQMRAMLYGGFYIDPARLRRSLGIEEDEPMPRFARETRSRRITEADDPSVPPGKVAFTRGNGTYNARLRLRAVGGRWEKDLLGGVWLVPEDAADAAEANIRLAERAGVELSVDEDPVTAAVEKVTCYVCGTKYLPWEFAQLKGAVVTDWYCGCEERKTGPAPRTATTRGAR